MELDVSESLPLFNFNFLLFFFKILVDKENKKPRRKPVSSPQLLDYNDKSSQRLCYLEDSSALFDVLDTELSMVDLASPSRLIDAFPDKNQAHLMESKARFHQFIRHCALENPEEILHVLKNYTFEGT